MKKAFIPSLVFFALTAQSRASTCGVAEGIQLPALNSKVVFQQNEQDGGYRVSLEAPGFLLWQKSYPITDASLNEEVAFNVLIQDDDCNANYSQLGSIYLEGDILYLMVSQPESHEPYLVKYNLRNHQRETLRLSLTEAATVSSFQVTKGDSVLVKFDAMQSQGVAIVSENSSKVLTNSLTSSLFHESAVADSNWVIYENTDLSLNAYSVLTGETRLVQKKLLEGTYCSNLNQTLGCLWITENRPVRPFMSCNDGSVALFTHDATGVGVLKVNLEEGSSVVSEKPNKNPPFGERLEKACSQ